MLLFCDYKRSFHLLVSFPIFSLCALTFSSWRNFSAFWLFFIFYFYFWDYYKWAYFFYFFFFFSTFALGFRELLILCADFIKQPILIFALGSERRRVLWKLQNWLNAGWNLVILPKFEYTIYSFRLGKCNTHSQSKQLCSCIPEAVTKYRPSKTGVLRPVKKLLLCFWTTQWLIFWHNSK